MKIYEKIIRRLKNIDGNIENIIKKDTLRKITKDIEILKSTNIAFGIEPLTITNLTDFYENIYIPIIGSKKNAKVHNLLEKMNPNEETDNNRFLIFIRDGNTLLGGGICNYINNILRFSYKCNTKDNLKLSVGFGTLIDFLFFSFGIEKSVECFTYGIDRNGYGELGADPGLCIHKLLLGFRPYTFSKNTLIEIDETNIKTPTIIFDDSDDDQEFKKTILLYRNNNTNNYIDILNKRGFIIKYL